MKEMDREKVEIACPVECHNHLSGSITDGDISRKLLKVWKLSTAVLIDCVIEHLI